MKIGIKTSFGIGSGWAFSISRESAYHASAMLSALECADKPASTAQNRNVHKPRLTQWLNKCPSRQRRHSTARGFAPTFGARPARPCVTRGMFATGRESADSELCPQAVGACKNTMLMRIRQHFIPSLKKSTPKKKAFHRDSNLLMTTHSNPVLQTTWPQLQRCQEWKNKYILCSLFFFLVLAFPAA